MLEMGQLTQLRTNELLHTQGNNIAARQGCSELINGGADAVDWLELTGRNNAGNQKPHSCERGSAISTPEGLCKKQ